MLYIFKTNVTTKVAIKKLAPALDKLSFITKWSFDLQDCDNILRIEATEFDTEIICGLLKSFGYCLLTDAWHRANFFITGGLAGGSVLKH